MDSFFLGCLCPQGPMGEGAVVGHVGTLVRVGRPVSQLSPHSHSCREWGACVVSSGTGSGALARTRSVR